MAPVATSGVMPIGTGDLLDGKANVSLYDNSLQEQLIGTASGKPASGWYMMARFEIEVPNGAIINSVKLDLGSIQGSRQNGSVGGTTNRWQGGLIAPDGKWESAKVAGFGTSVYPDRTTLPVVEVTIGTYSYTASRWHTGAPAFTNQTFASVAAGSPTLFSIGEGTTVTNAVTGLVSNFQSYLNTYGPTQRGNSVSGTALPVCLQMFRLDNSETNDWGIWICSSNHPTTSARPLLSVDFSTAAGPMTAKPSLGTVLSGRETAKAVISAEESLNPAIEARPGSRVAISGKPSLVSQPMGRGGIK